MRFIMYRMSIWERFWLAINPRARRQYEKRLHEGLAYLVRNSEIPVEFT